MRWKSSEAGRSHHFRAPFKSGYASTLRTDCYCGDGCFPVNIVAKVCILVRYRKKTATACAFAKQGRGLIKVNGQPIENIEPEALRLKVFEPVLILGQDKFSNLDIRIRVKGGGMTAQIYAIRAAIAKSIVAYYAKYVDESSKNELRRTLIEYDRNLLVSDPRRCEPKKYGGRSARARFQKSYR